MALVFHSLLPEMSYFLTSKMGMRGLLLNYGLAFYLTAFVQWQSMLGFHSNQAESLKQGRIF